MNMEEAITKDILFVGATRPPMIFGVTLEAFLFNGMISAIVFLGMGNPLYLFVGVPVHIISYLICLNEPRAFKLLSLKIKCLAQNRNRAFWKSNSYSPL